MASVEDATRPAIITFTWYFYNFSHCKSKENEIFYSPIFRAGEIEWILWLYPKGDRSPGFASFYLKPAFFDPADNTFMYQLSIQKRNGYFKDSDELMISKTIRRPRACKTFISLCELNEPDVYLGNDILTLRCRLWKRDPDVLQTVNCFTHSKIKVAKLDYLWILNDLVDTDGMPKHEFNRFTEMLHFSHEFPSVQICFSTEKTFTDDAIYFGIYLPHTNYKPLFAVYQIQLLDFSGSVAQTISGEVTFRKSSDIRKFPFLSKRKLLANKDSYLQGGKLRLKCEFSFSGNLEIERVEYGFTEVRNSKSVKPNLASDGHELWKENLRQFYSEGKFSDLIVRTPTREFPVHRAILCAQSEVFSEMLTHDMKEKNSGVFQIHDFEDDTVSKLLMYHYTNTVEDIDYALAKDLCLAAGKYRITPLQKICSNHLMDSMDTSNVCDILLLADELGDQELKSTARNLIVSSPHEIMNSDGWKNLKNTNLDLFVETTEWMILNKIPK